MNSEAVAKALYERVTGKLWDDLPPFGPLLMPNDRQMFTELATVALDAAELEFVGWLCPCHRRVVRANADGSKPDHHLISKDEGTFRCNISPELWQPTYVSS